MYVFYLLNYSNNSTATPIDSSHDSFKNNARFCSEISQSPQNAKIFQLILEK